MTDFEIIEKAVNEIVRDVNGEITDMAFYYDKKDKRYVILHNFHERFFKDDVFADKVSTLLYENLNKCGVNNYDFYEDENALSKLTMKFSGKASKLKSKSIFASSHGEEILIRTNDTSFLIDGNPIFPLSA